MERERDAKIDGSPDNQKGVAPHLYINGYKSSSDFKARGLGHLVRTTYDSSPCSWDCSIKKRHDIGNNPCTYIYIYILTSTSHV